MSVRRKPFAKDSATCQFPKSHSPKIRKDSPKIRQRVSSPKTIRQRFAKDSPTCQFAKNHSPKIRQRVSSPKIIPQRFSNVSVCQGPFAIKTVDIFKIYKQDIFKVVFCKVFCLLLLLRIFSQNVVINSCYFLCKLPLRTDAHVSIFIFPNFTGSRTFVCRTRRLYRYTCLI